MHPALTVVDGDAPALRRVLLHGLAPSLHRPEHGAEPRWICVAVGATEHPVGGLIGLTTGAWFSIDLLWLPEPMRDRGVGAAVLHLAELRAAESGCIGAYVTATSTAACRFYESNGYVARLSLPGLRPGLTQVTLQKDFEDAPAPSNHAL